MHHSICCGVSGMHCHMPWSSISVTPAAASCTSRSEKDEPVGLGKRLLFRVQGACSGFRVHLVSIFIKRHNCLRMQSSCTHLLRSLLMSHLFAGFRLLSCFCHSWPATARPVQITVVTSVVSTATYICQAIKGPCLVTLSQVSLL